MKILYSNVGAFVNELIQQLRTGVTDLQGVGITVTPADITVEFNADIIYDAQSLAEVTSTSTTKSGSVSTPEKTRTQTEGTTDTTSTGGADTTTNDTTDTTTRSSTTTQDSGGTDTDNSVYDYSNH